MLLMQEVDVSKKMLYTNRIQIHARMKLVAKHAVTFNLN